MNLSMVEPLILLPLYQQAATDKILKSAASCRTAVSSVQNLLACEKALATKAKINAMRGQLTDWDTVRAYLFAGKAVFTLVNPKSGIRLTYKVTAKKQNIAEKTRREAAGEAVHENFVTYFVNLLRGPDNTADYTYMGVLRKPGDFFITSKSQVGRHPVSHKALIYFLDRMRNSREVLGGKPLEFWHSGRCGCCSRLLTVPASVARGIGPECARMGMSL